MKIITSFFAALISLSLPGQPASSQLDQRLAAHVFFSQDLYVGGDTAFFRVALLPDGGAEQQGSSLFHVDLIDHNGAVVFRQNFRAEGGSGGNQLIIPSQLAPGAYLFNLRLNDDPGSILTHVIMIAGKKTGGVVEKSAPPPLATQPTQQPPAIEITGVNPEYAGRQKVEVMINTRLNHEAIRPTVAVRVLNSKIVRWDSAKNLAVNGNPLNRAQSALMRNSEDGKPRSSNALTWEGKVLYKNTSTPVPDSTHVAVFLQKNKMGYDFYTEKDGHFKVTCTSDFFEDDKVFVLASYQEKELPVDWVLTTAESTVPRAPSVQYSVKDDWYSSFSENKRDVDRAFYFFKNNSSAMLAKTDGDDRLEDEFQSPDIVVNMKDYLIFPTIEEIVNEIIPSLSLKRKDDEVILKMNLLISLDNPVASKATPLLVIDNVMTKDLNAFLSLKPAELVSIKLIRKMNKLLPWGLLGKDGIVFVTTKNTAIAKELVAYYPDVKGLTEAIPYVSKNYSRPGDPLIPDFRTLLYWNPALPLDADGRAVLTFYTSDSIGEFVIQVEGETKEGAILRGTQPFQVSFTPRGK